MIAEKLGDKKNLVYGAVAVIILVIGGYFAINKFFPSGIDIDTAASSQVAGKIFNPGKIDVKLDLDLFEKEKYRNLRDNRVALPDVSDIKVGKDNPFEKD